MSAFKPVATLADLGTLDNAEIVAGYRDYAPYDPEPGINRGRAYWHGFMNAARDHHNAPPTRAAAQLAHEMAASWPRASK